MNIENIDLSKQLDMISLTTLSEKYNLQVVTMENPEDKKQNMKIVFARTFTMGVIVNDTYFLKPEFFKGGKHYNVFIENETKLIQETYKLKKVEKLDHETVTAGLIEELQNFKKLSDTVKDIRVMDGINEKAKILMKDLGSEEAKNIYFDIHSNYMKLKEENESSKTQLNVQLSEIVEELEEITGTSEIDLKIKKDLIDQGNEVLQKLPITEQTKYANILFKNETEKLLKALQPPLEDKKVKTLRDSQEEEYQKMIKEADKSFDQQNYKKAKSLYASALELRPTRNHAPEKLAEIKRLISKK